MQWSGQAADREDIKRQAGSKGRQQMVRVVKTVQVINRETHLGGNRSEISDSAKQDFAMSVSVKDA